ncbi:hypothetical protein Plec18170_000548 [Paecilomyces lecythidis]
MGHPVLKLTEQFRYRSVFAAWPNVRTYDGLLKSHPSTQTIVVNSQFTNALKEVLCVENATLDLGNIVVSVEGSLCEVDEASKSRYNDTHSHHDITVITPYQAQAMRIRQSLFKMGERGILGPFEVPKVTTIDSMQGKESRVIIYD